MFENESLSKLFFEFINKQHDNLKFTYENSKNNMLPFLDVQVILDDSMFHTSVYRKSTFTGLLLNFKAMCPSNWYSGLIMGMLHRTYTACTDWKAFNLEIDNIKRILIENSYPVPYIDNIIRKFLDNKFSTNVPTQSDNDNRKYTLKIPFIGLPSVLLKKKLFSIFNRNNLNVNIVFSTFKVRNYFSLKDKTDKLLRSSVVYKFQCLNDSNCSYIGKTKRYLTKRVSEHKKSTSAIHSHLSSCNTCKNSASFIDQFTVIDRGNTDFDIQILEAIHIFQDRPTLNKQLSNNGSSYILTIF